MEACCDKVFFFRSKKTVPCAIFPRGLAAVASLSLSFPLVRSFSLFVLLPFCPPLLYRVRTPAVMKRGRRRSLFFRPARPLAPCFSDATASRQALLTKAQAPPHGSPPSVRDSRLLTVTSFDEDDDSFTNIPRRSRRVNPDSTSTLRWRARVRRALFEGLLDQKRT